MYVPRRFSVDDQDEIAAFVAGIGVADLVTFDGAKPIASLIPIIWDRSEGEHGRLLGHLALANEQWRSVVPGTVALAIVHGPHAYISPSWYPSTYEHGRAVPTWNYVTAHLTGPLTVHRDPAWLRSVVTRLTQANEAGRPRPWQVSDAPPDYVAGHLRAIVGVEMAVATVEASYKLSQNRGVRDQEGAAQGLRDEPGAGPAVIADLMAASARSQAAESGG